MLANLIHDLRNCNTRTPVFRSRILNGPFSAGSTATVASGKRLTSSTKSTFFSSFFFPQQPMRRGAPFNDIVKTVKTAREQHGLHFQGFVSLIHAVKISRILTFCHARMKPSRAAENVRSKWSDVYKKKVKTSKVMPKFISAAHLIQF